WLYNTLEEVLEEALHSAEVTHNHPEGIRGAQATAAAVYYARQNADKEAIKNYIEENFGYNLSSTLDDIRPAYSYDVSCQGSVPQAMIAFLESTDFEDAIRNAVSLGGDSDTQACIAGSIAEAYYGEIPEGLAKEALSRLDERLLGIYNSFQERVSETIKGT
ncbi:MAG: ADP-ribosylglycohydrolase family protein, partial [Gammaproteobacteria bacterium]|nr:ADP-ribosylglycohydrolase family protein [Gammaproteobacteria bacterium]NIR92340.1 ADP-ribosylglycohydrolase family protein [Gammaproteobacteria bacterium]